MTKRLDFSSMPAEVAERFNVASFDGTRIATYRLHAAPDHKPAAVLLWAHANGFSAGSYLPLLQQLTDDFVVYGYDMRGHGGSEYPPAPLNDGLSFDAFAEDLRHVVLAAMAREADDAQFYFAGHSFSAAAMYHLGGNRGFAPWHAVTTFDATMMPSDNTRLADWARETGTGRIGRTLRRRKTFKDIDAYRLAISRPGAFDTWEEPMLRAHARASAKPMGDRVTLACPPEVEAGVYLAVMDDEPYSGLGNFAPPALLVGADANANGTWVGQVQHSAAACLPNGRAVVMEGCGHMMPFEKPHACAAHIRAMLGA